MLWDSSVEGLWVFNIFSTNRSSSCSLYLSIHCYSSIRCKNPSSFSLCIIHPNQNMSTNGPMDLDLGKLWRPFGDDFPCWPWFQGERWGCHNLPRSIFTYSTTSASGTAMAVVTDFSLRKALRSHAGCWIVQSFRGAPGFVDVVDGQMLQFREPMSWEARLGSFGSL